MQKTRTLHKIMQRKREAMEQNHKTSADDNMIELRGQIIDIFEDFLTEKGITLDKGQQKKTAVIYGRNYDILCSGITKILHMDTAGWPTDKCSKDASGRMLYKFGIMLVKNGCGMDIISYDDWMQLDCRIQDTLKNWQDITPGRNRQL